MPMEVELQENVKALALPLLRCPVRYHSRLPEAYESYQHHGVLNVGYNRKGLTSYGIDHRPDVHRHILIFVLNQSGVRMR